MTTSYPSSRDNYSKPFLLSFSVVTGMLRNLAASQYFIDTSYHGLMTFVIRPEHSQFHDLIIIPCNGKQGFINSDTSQLVVTVNARREPIDLFLVKQSVISQGKTAVSAALDKYEADKKDHTIHHLRGASVVSLGEQLLIMHHTVVMAKNRQFFDHRVVVENMPWRYIPLLDRIVMSGPNADIEVLYSRDLLAAVVL